MHRLPTMIGRNRIPLKRRPIAMERGVIVVRLVANRPFGHGYKDTIRRRWTHRRSKWMVMEHPNRLGYLTRRM